MTTDIFDFWDNVRVRDGKHPADYEVLSRVRHNFCLRALPAAFSGCLRTAPVVLLFLSPGLSEFDFKKSEIARYRRLWSGREPLPGPDDHETAWRWWKRQTKCFGGWEELRTKVAILNICAYHAKPFRDWHLLAALPSSRVSLDWAQHVLFPEAIAGRRVVVCLRSARYWGLAEGQCYRQALFAPLRNRSGSMNMGEMRDIVIRKVKAILARHTGT